MRGVHIKAEAFIVIAVLTGFAGVWKSTHRRT